MIFAAVDAPTMMDRFGAMNDILDSTYSYILCFDWFSSRAMSHASSSCFSSSSLSSDLYPQKKNKINRHCTDDYAIIRSIDKHVSEILLSWDSEDAVLWVGVKSINHRCVNSPLCGRGCDTDNHNGGVGENLLQSFIVLAFFQIISQFLK